MKILAMNGSPKKDGTSSRVANALMEKLNIPQHEIKKYELNSLDIHGCQECFYCRNKKTDVCGIKDDLSEILESVKTTDVLIVSSPVFYADVSAQLKCFIDRTWSYYGKTGMDASHLPRDRVLVFVLSYGYNNQTVYDQLYQKYTYYFKMFGFDMCYFIKAYAAQYNDPEIVNKIEVAGFVDEISRKINDLRERINK